MQSLWCVWAAATVQRSTSFYLADILCITPCRNACSWLLPLGLYFCSSSRNDTWVRSSHFCRHDRSETLWGILALVKHKTTSKWSQRLIIRFWKSVVLVMQFLLILTNLHRNFSWDEMVKCLYKKSQSSILFSSASVWLRNKRGVVKIVHISSDRELMTLPSSTSTRAGVSCIPVVACSITGAWIGKLVRSILSPFWLYIMCLCNPLFSLQQQGRRSHSFCTLNLIHALLEWPRYANLCDAHSTQTH